MSAANGNTAATNPGNFANRPTEEVKAIASMGGKSSHKNDGKEDNANDGQESKDSHPGRNPDGTFTKGSVEASKAGHVGGLHANGKTEEGADNTASTTDNGRNPDGTFKKGSEAAKEAGAKSHGGH